MYGLPKNFNSSFLKGKIIEQVSFAQYQVNLFFCGNVWIGIEGAYKLFHEDRLLENVNNFPLSNSKLLLLIGKLVKDVSFESKSGNILIEFDDGYKLLIFGDVGPYEAYTLFNGVNEIIV